jgi:hypothetical protein
MKLSLQGAPTINGEVLKYGKIQGQLIINTKKGALQTIPVQGKIRDGSLDLQAQDLRITCHGEMLYLTVELAAISRKHSINSFSEKHSLNVCEKLEGKYELNEPITEAEIK